MDKRSGDLAMCIVFFSHVQVEKGGRGVPVCEDNGDMIDRRTREEDYTPLWNITFDSVAFVLGCKLCIAILSVMSISV